MWFGAFQMFQDNSFTQGPGICRFTTGLLTLGVLHPKQWSVIDSNPNVDSKNRTLRMFLDDVDWDLWFRFKILASHYPKQSGQPEGSATNPPGTHQEPACGSLWVLLYLLMQRLLQLAQIAAQQLLLKSTMEAPGEVFHEGDLWLRIHGFNDGNVMSWWWLRLLDGIWQAIFGTQPGIPLFFGNRI